MSDFCDKYIKASILINVILPAKNLSIFEQFKNFILFKHSNFSLQNLVKARGLVHSVHSKFCNSTLPSFLELISSFKKLRFTINFLNCWLMVFKRKKDCFMNQMNT